MKKKIFLIIIIFGLCNNVSAEDCGENGFTPDNLDLWITNNITSHEGSKEFAGYYTTYSEAYAAANRSRSYWMDHTEQYEGQSYRVICNWGSNASWAWYTWAIIIPECVDPVPPDTDGDGIPDDLDATPDNSDDYNIRLVSYQEDETGAHTWELYIDEFGGYFELGTQDETESAFVTISSPWQSAIDKLSSNPQDYQDSSGNELEYNLDGEPTSSADGLNSGNDNTGNSLETDYLGDIVTNTQDALANQQVIANYLKDINSGITSLGGAVGSISSGGSSYFSTGTDMSGVEGKLDDIEESLETEEGYSDNPDAVLPDQEGLGGAIDNYLDTFENNAMSNFLNNSEIQNTNVSSNFTMQNYYTGETISVDFGQWQSEFDTVGSILLSFVSIAMGLYLFRG